MDFYKKEIENVYIPYVYIKLAMLFLFWVSGKNIGNLGSSILKIVTLEDRFIRVIVLQYISFFILRNVLKKGNILIVASLASNCIWSCIFIIEQRPLR